jgi:NADPH-dependent ferric siderophore reductase
VPPTETDVRRAAYHPFVARVVRVARLSPHFVRVTFTGPDFAHFGSAGPDQRIKVLLPHADGGFADLGQHDGTGEWYDTWRALPVAERNLFRTYTIRRMDRATAELDVDFVVHHDAGPAGEWADRAEPGQELLIVGADERAGDPVGGYDWHPGSARRVLLAGDETAVPAIVAILESLAPGFEADAFVEVPTAADALVAPTAPGIRLHWLPREDRAHGAALTEAVTAWADGAEALLTRAAAPRPQELAEIDVDRELLWDSPEDAEGEFYAWIAGEAATVKGLRRMLVSQRGVDRRRVAFMGYWRLGQSERTE